MQWFRFYTEAISDKKLRRIARDNNESMAHVLGVWAIVLSMASDSPVRGQLLISNDVPATIEDIEDAAGCNVTATFQKLLVTGLVTELVTNDGKTVYIIPAWDKRQFDSDSSATRVRKHRERQKAAKSNDGVTLQKRFCNAPDTDTDTDSNTNVPASAGSASAELTPPPPATSLSSQFHAYLEELKVTPNKPATLRSIYALCFGADAAPDYGYLGKTARQVGGAGRLAQLMFELVPRPPAGDVLAYIVAEENARKKRAAQTGGNREVIDIKFANSGGDDIYA